MTSNPETQDLKIPASSEGNDPKSGENDSSKAITGAVEAGWGGSVADTNDAFEKETDSQDKKD